MAPPPWETIWVSSANGIGFTPKNFVWGLAVTLGPPDYPTWYHVAAMAPTKLLLCLADEVDVWGGWNLGHCRDAEQGSRTNREAAGWGGPLDVGFQVRPCKPAMVSSLCSCPGAGVDCEWLRRHPPPQERASFQGRPPSQMSNPQPQALRAPQPCDPIILRRPWVRAEVPRCGWLWLGITAPPWAAGTWEREVPGRGWAEPCPHFLPAFGLCHPPPEKSPAQQVCVLEEGVGLTHREW